MHALHEKANRVERINERTHLAGSSSGLTFFDCKATLISACEQMVFRSILDFALDLLMVVLEKMTSSVHPSMPMLTGHHVTAIMFAVYLGILYLAMTRWQLVETPVVLRLTLEGISFGMFTHLLIWGVNQIRLLLGGDTTQIVQVLLVTPAQEELAKFVLLLLAFQYSEWVVGKMQFTNGRSNRMVLLGVSIGLAFAVVENILSYGYLDGLATLVRTLLPWPLHLLTTGLSAYGLFRFQTSKRIIVLVIFLLFAIIIHFVFNLANVLF